MILLYMFLFFSFRLKLFTFEVFTKREQYCTTKWRTLHSSFFEATYCITNHLRSERLVLGLYIYTMIGHSDKNISE